MQGSYLCRQSGEGVTRFFFPNGGLSEPDGQTLELLLDPIRPSRQSLEDVLCQRRECVDVVSVAVVGPARVRVPKRRLCGR